ncbi:hypothetical protein GGF46_000151 [Coemansia sp. RSA 552]|nr:hypothetical protein GGF46_000151 [Coemansia sp. RSA 552]
MLRFRKFAEIQRRHETTGAHLDLRPQLVYEGGLAKAAKVMKLASVASLVGASAAVPFFFTGTSDVPEAARAILALTTVGMTASSTVLVTWALRAYITKLNVIHLGSSEEIGPQTPLLVETMTFLAQTKSRLVFPEQLVPATMPMTSWATKEASAAAKEAARPILEQINRGSSSKPTTLAQPGDLFYAHIAEGAAISNEMKKIIAVSPCQ